MSAPALRVAAPALAPRLASILVCLHRLGETGGCRNEQPRHISRRFFSCESASFFLRSGRVSNALPHAPLCSPPTPIFKTGFRIARAHSDPCGRSFTQIPAAEGSQGTVCRGYIAGSSFSTLPFDQSQVCDAIFETACRLKAAVGSPRSIRSSIWTAWTVVQDLDQEK
jgi:hypothetical protein